MLSTHRTNNQHKVERFASFPPFSLCFSSTLFTPSLSSGRYGMSALTNFHCCLQYMGCQCSSRHPSEIWSHHYLFRPKLFSVPYISRCQSCTHILFCSLRPRKSNNIIFSKRMIFIDFYLFHRCGPSQSRLLHQKSTTAKKHIPAYLHITAFKIWYSQTLENSLLTN